MQCQVTFRHMKPSDPIRQYAEERIEKLHKYIDERSEAHVVLSVEKHQHQAHFELIIAGAMRARADEKSEDMYTSIDQAVEKLLSQVRRYRSKMQKGHHKSHKDKTRELPYQVIHLPKTGEGEAETFDSPQVVRQETVVATEMKLADAVVQMEMLNSDFLVYTDADSHMVNVMYRLPDGQYGLIETQPSA